jgi:hypothetical protein
VTSTMTKLRLLTGEADIVVAWGDDPGCDWFGLFQVSTAGARNIAHAELRAGEKEGLTELFRRRGVRIGATNGELVWVFDESGFTLWTWERLVTDSPPGELQLRDATVAAGDIVTVVAFVDPVDLGHRGVLVETRDGDPHLVLDEHDSDAEIPPYDLEDALRDGEWARRLAVELAQWLGVALRLDTPVERAAPLILDDDYS